MSYGKSKLDDPYVRRAGVAGHPIPSKYGKPENRRIMATFDPDTFEQLTIAARAVNRPISAVIRKAVARYLKEKQQ